LYRVRYKMYMTASHAIRCRSALAPYPRATHTLVASRAGPSHASPLSPTTPHRPASPDPPLASRPHPSSAPYAVPASCRPPPLPARVRTAVTATPSSEPTPSPATASSHRNIRAYHGTRRPRPAAPANLLSACQCSLSVVVPYPAVVRPSGQRSTSCANGSPGLSWCRPVNRLLPCRVCCVHHRAEPRIGEGDPCKSLQVASGDPYT
jgi:hypothetical protein